MLDLKICSVNYNSNEYLKMNRALTKPSKVDWLVVNNHPEDELLEGFQYIEGLFDFQFDNAGQTISKASYHHAAALNKACRSGLLNARYILFLDPDFFVLPDLTKCIEHMQKNNLAFFGAPYSIEPGKIRTQDFPVAFCMFIDTHQVDIKSFDFTPKNSVTFSTDTGHEVYAKFMNSGLKYEATLPVNEHKEVPTTRHSPVSLKSRYGMIPEGKVDQYFWNDKLFGLHYHMKLHLRKGEEIYKRSYQHCLNVTRIIRAVRKFDDTTL